jgi:hypothetical protein
VIGELFVQRGGDAAHPGRLMIVEMQHAVEIRHPVARLAHSG